MTATPETLALFDLDGTLLQARDELHHAAFDHALRVVFGAAASVSSLDKAAALDRILVRQAATAAGVEPSRIDADTERVMAVMGRYYALRVGPGDRVDRVLPGVAELLRRLRAIGIPVAVATGSARLVAQAKLHAAGLAEYLPSGAFGDEANDRPALLRQAIVDAGAVYGRRFLAGKAIVIGDTPGDISAARAVGARVLAVATGRFSVDELDEHGPDFSFPHLNSPDAVIRAIRGDTMATAQ